MYSENTPESGGCQPRSGRGRKGWLGSGWHHRVRHLRSDLSGKGNCGRPADFCVTVASQLQVLAGTGGPWRTKDRTATLELAFGLATVAQRVWNYSWGRSEDCGRMTRADISAHTLATVTEQLGSQHISFARAPELFFAAFTTVLRKFDRSGSIAIAALKGGDFSRMLTTRPSAR